MRSRDPRIPSEVCQKSRRPSPEDDGASGRFYKTRMCLFHQKGACIKGPACGYAHSQEELRPTPDLLKTRLCQDWLNGNCTSIHCKFAHGRHELRFTHDYYKTKICHFWQQSGCTKGAMCRHAHGVHELRPMPKGGEEDGFSRSSTRSSASINLSRSPTHGGVSKHYEASVPYRVGERSFPSPKPDVDESSNPVNIGPNLLSALIESKNLKLDGDTLLMALLLRQIGGQ